LHTTHTQTPTCTPNINSDHCPELAWANRAVSKRNRKTNMQNRFAKRPSTAVEDCPSATEPSSTGEEEEEEEEEEEGTLS
jgi:hypothetical protein